MRIDLPSCNFKNCRNSFDGNCKSIDCYRNCEYKINISIAKAILEACAEEIENCYGRETETSNEARHFLETVY